MNPGDLVRLSNQGNPVRIADDVLASPRAKHTYPAGTLAILIEIGEIGKDGPGMETPALVMIGDVIGWIWLYECEEIKHETR